MKMAAISGYLLRHKGTVFCAVLFYFITVSNLNAQKTILTAGGDIISTNQGSVNYSVGQIAYTEVTGSTGYIIQGVQQPYRINEVNGIDEANNINLAVSVYPNPVNDFLILNMDNFPINDCSYQLFDLNGNLLRSMEISDNEIRIDVRGLASNIFFLKVIEGNREIKSFKIIKNSTESY